MSEIVMMVPLFVILVGGALSITYMCWQGIKVQQAANLAARIQGQERVSGGASESSISQDNGLDGGIEQEPDDSSIGALVNNPGALNGFKARPTGGVYGKYYEAVHAMFGAGEQQKLFVPPPYKQGVNTDALKVIRVLNPPKFLGFQLKPIKLEARAYGGEDAHMYGLPRWGRAENSSGQFYTGAIKNPDGN